MDDLPQVADLNQTKQYLRSFFIIIKFPFLC